MSRPNKNKIKRNNVIMALKTRTSKNSSLKNSIVKVNLKTSLKPPPSHVAQLNTPTKDYFTTTIIMPNKHQIEESNVDNSTSPTNL